MVLNTAGRGFAKDHSPSPGSLNCVCGCITYLDVAAVYYYHVDAKFLTVGNVARVPYRCVHKCAPYREGCSRLTASHGCWALRLGLSAGLRSPTQQSRVVGRCTAVFSDVIRVIQRGKVDNSHYTGRNVSQWPPVGPVYIVVPACEG